MDRRTAFKTLANITGLAAIAAVAPSCAAPKADETWFHDSVPETVREHCRYVPGSVRYNMLEHGPKNPSSPVSSYLYTYIETPEGEHYLLRSQWFYDVPDAAFRNKSVGYLWRGSRDVVSTLSLPCDPMECLGCVIGDGLDPAFVMPRSRVIG